MSFVETFAECSQTHTNFEKPGPLANIELESTPNPCLEDSQEQLTQEPENNDDPDGHFSFWKGIQPMLKQLTSLEALKFKHEVHGLLISYIERSQAKSSHFPTVHTVHPSSFPETNIASPSPTPSSLESHAEYEQNGPPRPPYHEGQYYQF
ncbi:hypothetical protein PoB_005064900 [Plakobranchus ocellatus]|uniref:BESS domain-containing protein n=1 Tax=Plakobranchus ocellatus TaxID=259542 RepID=A0AAV4BZ49_9GAST|nr:hypothetical protein PoB_005064900 [Plakobranchus ocellatus]